MSCCATETDWKQRYDELRVELDSVKRREVAMRLAIISTPEYALSGSYKAHFNDALSTGAGSDLLTREQVKPLADALNGIKTCCNPWQQLVVITDIGLEILYKALAHAKTLGFAP